MKVERVNSANLVERQTGIHNLSAGLWRVESEKDRRVLLISTYAPKFCEKQGKWVGAMIIDDMDRNVEEEMDCYSPLGKRWEEIAFIRVPSSEKFILGN